MVHYISIHIIEKIQKVFEFKGSGCQTTDILRSCMQDYTCNIFYDQTTWDINTHRQKENTTIDLMKINHWVTNKNLNISGSVRTVTKTVVPEQHNFIYG